MPLECFPLKCATATATAPPAHDHMSLSKSVFMSLLSLAENLPWGAEGQCPLSGVLPSAPVYKAMIRNILLGDARLGAKRFIY